MALAAGHRAASPVGGLPSRPVADGWSSKPLGTRAALCGHSWQFVRTATAAVIRAIRAVRAVAQTRLHAVELGLIGVDLGASALRLLTALPPFGASHVCLPACLPACLPTCLRRGMPACLGEPTVPYSTAQARSAPSTDKAEEFIARLKPIVDAMLRTGVLSADDVGLAQSANAFLTLEKDGLPVLVAAQLHSAVHRLLLSSNGIRAARKGVCQDNTKCAIQYEICFQTGGVDNLYNGEAKHAFCDHHQTFRNRMRSHFCQNITGEHCNYKFRRAFRSAPSPRPPTDAHRRRRCTHGWSCVGAAGWSLRQPGRTCPPSWASACD